MRILIDITHPAHLHVFRHAISLLKSEGHQILLTGRDKDILRALAAEYQLEIDFFGKAPKTIGGLFLTLIYRKAVLAKKIRMFHPDVMAAVGGTFIAFIGKVMRVPTVVFYDTEDAVLSNIITYPFATRVCTPQCYLGTNIPHHIRYPGYQELAYLRNNRFKPDPMIRDALGVRPGVPYAILRFVAWKASHDIGIKGLTLQQKISAVKELSKIGQVFISAEDDLPEEIKKFRFSLPVARIHDAIASASIVFGESSTMASEAAILGVPSVFVYPELKRGYVKEEVERWGIVHWYPCEKFDDALAQAKSIMRANASDHWKKIGQEINKHSIDVTDFIVDQIENIKR